MLRNLRIPIRFKILLTQLLVVIAVLTLITYTMARLFHTDKTAYIHDLTSVIALHTAEETQSLLVGYQERLQVFARLMADENLFVEQKEQMLSKLLEDFREFVTVTLYRDGAEAGTVFDGASLEAAGVSLEDLNRFRREHPLPFAELYGGQVFLANSTVAEQLPTLTLALAVPGEKEANQIVAATVRLEKLLRLARRSRVFETFVVDGQGTLLAHSDPAAVAGRARLEWVSQLEGITSDQSFGGTSEYVQDGVEMVAGIARVEFGGLLSGVQIPKNAAYLTARELLADLMWVALALLGAAVLLSLFWSRRLTRPIERLSAATRQVARGDFNVQLEAAEKDELGDLAGSFNQMATEIKSAQAALVQSEKMAAFGQLGAGIAHEVKNPLGGILGLAQLSLRKAEKDSPMAKNLTIIEKETRRCKEIVENLLRFARQEKVAFGPFNLNLVAEDATAIVAHQLAINQVKLKKEFAPELPKVVCNPNQIQQVLINFLINAQQAMDGEPGSVTVTTRAAGPDQVQVLVSDTGPGIPKEIQAKIFEPFFTTKAAGKGTGLGLSVTYGIIQEHKGEIRLESEPGQGTTFILTFPAAGSAHAPATTYEKPAEAL